MFPNERPTLATSTPATRTTVPSTCSAVQPATARALILMMESYYGDHGDLSSGKRLQFAIENGP